MNPSFYKYFERKSAEYVEGVYYISSKVVVGRVLKILESKLL